LKVGEEGEVRVRRVGRKFFLEIRGIFDFGREGEAKRWVERREEGGREGSRELYVEEKGRRTIRRETRRRSRTLIVSARARCESRRRATDCFSGSLAVYRSVDWDSRSSALRIKRL